jgi:hypothetical protein
MAEFADVFDPSGDPQKAMVGMMQVIIIIQPFNIMFNQ